MKEYIYRYLDNNRPVYVIKRACKDIGKPQIYSEPYYSKERREARNAIVAYVDKELCYQKLFILQNTDTSLYIKQYELIDLEGKCLSLAMPLNVVINEYCDIEEKKEYSEIFYYDSCR